MNKKTLLTITMLMYFLHGYAQKRFSNVDSLIQYATTKSITVKSNEIRLTQANKAKLAAVFNIIDPAGNAHTSFTNNTQLPVSLFPAETFGGTPGTFKEIQTGIQYNTAVQLGAEIKLLNLSGWESFKLATINIDITSSNNKISLKNLHQNISNNFYNIVSLQQQLSNAKQHLIIADTLYKIVEYKYQQGLVKQQDVNDSKANKLGAEENIRQLQFLLTQYYISLKLLCDIPEEEAIEIENNISLTTSTLKPIIATNELALRNSLSKEHYALSALKQLQKAQLPSISLLYNRSYQNFNTSFKPYSGSWFPNENIGLRFSIPIPNSTTIANIYNAKYNYQLAQKASDQERIKALSEQKQLSNEYDKAISQFENYKAIMQLRKDSYEKNENLYKQGLISIDQTLNSYTAFINSVYNYTSAQVNTLLIQSKININNNFK